MTRYLFDGGELVLNPDGTEAINFAFTVWTARVGGTDVTGDMMAPDGVTPATVQTNVVGEIPYLRGPDGTRLLFRDMGTATRSAYYSSEALQELFNAIPPGGTAGQLLGKASATSYDDQWVDPAAGGGGLPAGTTLEQIPNGPTRLAMTQPERDKLAATPSSFLQIGTTANTAMAGNTTFSPAGIGAVQNVTGVPRLWCRVVALGQAKPTAAEGAQVGDILIFDES